ncbi:uncharacterized protein LOC129601785 [Paramacrobiotus metropolitanus]|uniref:uncharacterized protein LOC129601785 n=1 Tax=Paramacrobiotus metropolitanus TaxID=2943436 RepID=UPI0024457122|nr:uncharacterized protein LOC129601785 [Paramacrobiotus metropolitanus]
MHESSANHGLQIIDYGSKPTKPQHSDAADSSDYLGSADFPYHLLLHILRYLSPRDILASLFPANQHLHRVLGEESLWRSRLRRVFRAQPYPILPGPESPGEWRRRAYHVETEREMYREEADTVCPLTRRVFQIAEDGHRVNAVHFLRGGRWLVAGGTDHRVTLWDAEAVQQAPSGPSGISDGDHVEAARSVLHKHADWVTSLQSREGKVSSGSMDRTIKILDVHASAGRRLSVAPTITLLSERGVFCHAWQNDLVVAGYHSAVELFDIRSKNTPILTKTSEHDDLNLVWDIAFRGQQVFLLSSDGALRVLDLRSRRFTSSITMPVGEHGVRLSLHDGVCCVASNGGGVRMYAADSLQLLEDLSGAFDFSREHRVVGVHYNDAHVLAASAQGLLRMLEPVRAGRVLWQWRPPAGTGNFRCMDYAGDNSMAVSSTNHMWLWRPRN